jgi:hypothetical protein
LAIQAAAKFVALRDDYLTRRLSIGHGCEATRARRDR